ncbi:MAG: acetyl-CoA synthase subunit gamma [Candidatus Saganbacteria bacterium]|nr:acetyl-CoA synthase subunit gamma [Candidatus Saganbacteria bacterium]
MENIKRVSTELTFQDKFQSTLVRWGVGRMVHKIDPGIYAVNNPTKDSPVFVSANYKLSFDALRKELKGIDAFIMVIDTKGINVWCAAGKGTFGTDEIVNRIEKTKLKEIVSHRKIILPQLGAPGTSAHELQKKSGFQVVYGPVRASDIPAFLKVGMKVTPQMREVTFNLSDRIHLIPMELVAAAKYVLVVIFAFYMISILTGKTDAGVRAAINVLLAYFAGAVLGPIMLPRLPGKSFSMKGFFVGLIVVGASCSFNWIGRGPAEIFSWMLMMPAISSMILMNFTGASTYASPSGVQKEMRIAVPLQLAAIGFGLFLWLIERLFGV